MLQRATWRGAPGAVAAIALAACSPDLHVPDGAQIECASGDCPSGFTCTASKRCVPTDAIDVQPPSIAGAPAVSPPVARTGVDPTVSFTATEALGSDPVVRVDVGVPRTLTKVSGNAPGLAYVYAYARAGDEPQGTDCPITVDLTDTQGVTSTGLAAGALRFDDAAPSALAPSVAGSPARTGDTIRVTFTASEPLASDPAVRAGAGLAFTKDPASAGRAYVYVRTSDGAEPQDLAGLSVTATLTDAAGNQAEVVLGSAVFDRTAPGLLAPPQVTPLAAAAGTLVRVTFTADEDLGEDPVVTLGSLALEKGQQVGRTYAYSRLAAAPDGDGERPLEIALADVAGNASGAIPGPTVRFDFTAPAVTALTVCDDDGTAGPCALDRRTFSAQPGHDRVKLKFTLSEPPAPGADGLVVSVANVRLGTSGPDACASADGLSWTCTATVTDPAGGADPRVASATVSIAAVDAAGNAGTLLAFLTYDFRPPGLAGTPYFERCDAYPPARLGANDLHVKPAAAYSAAGCPLTACGISGPVRVQLTLDEPVVLGAGGVRLDDGTPLQVAACASSPTQLVAVLGTDGAAGDRQVTADVVDAAGNPGRLALGTLRVDLSPPAAPDTTAAGRVVFQRFPWGADATRGARAYFLQGAAGAVAGGATVVAYDGPDPATAAEIGRVTATASGAFGASPGAAGAFSVASGDRPEVFVAQEDPAGNRSPTALVWDALWTATPGFKQPGQTSVNPNAFTEEPAWRDSRLTAAQREPPDPTLAAAAGGPGVVTTGEPDLRRAAGSPDLPPKLGGCRMAYDPDLGRAVMFGGRWSVYAVGNALGADTWEWDGAGWRQLVTPDRPPARTSHAFAYDEARRRFVLFGGTTGAGLAGDTWELDGERWRRVCWPGCTASQCTCTRMPSARQGAAAFHDPVLGQTILAGGQDAGGARNDTWAWNGEDWKELAPAAAPLAHVGANVAVSPELGQVMLLRPGGGTFLWDGTTWTSHAAASGGGSSIDLWWDPGDQKFHRLQMAGRIMETWNGSAWVFVTAGFPAIGDVSAIDAPLVEPCGAFDRERGGYVRFGGCVDGTCRTDYSATQHTALFTWQAVRLLTPSVFPAQRAGAVVTDYPIDGLAWLYGGRGPNRYAYPDQWTWDGATWRSDAPSGAGAFEGSYDAVMAAVGGRLVRLFGEPTGGGVPPSAGVPLDTWVHVSPGWGWSYWSGDFSFYVEPVSSTDLYANAHQALAIDEATGRGVFFRSSVGAPTWTVRWVDYWAPWYTHGDTAGMVWEQATTATTVPASVRGHRLATCPAAGGVLLFGGSSAGGAYLDETYAWSGTNWVLRNVSPRPPARAEHAMFCDRNRGKLYVVGGLDASGERDDVWEWDGTAWRERSPAERPSPRQGAAATWHAVGGKAVLFGGIGNGYQADTWLFDGGRDLRPAQVFHARFGAAAASDVTFLGVTATFLSGATSYSAGGTVQGVQLFVRDRGAWRPAGAASASPATTPGALGWSTAVDPEWTAPGAGARLRRLFSGDGLDLSIAVAPRGTNRTQAPGARLVTPYAEVAVRYRLACLPAGASTTNAPRCCSGSASGNVCQ